MRRYLFLFTILTAGPLLPESGVLAGNLTTPLQPFSQTTPTVPAYPAVPTPTRPTLPALPITPTTVTSPNDFGPAVPVRGMDMANVAHIFGAPLEKIAPVPSPGTKLHPPITRWVYPDYVVYFEYNNVIHTVLKADPFGNARNT